MSRPNKITTSFTPAVMYRSMAILQCFLLGYGAKEVRQLLAVNQGMIQDARLKSRQAVRSYLRAAFERLSENPEAKKLYSLTWGRNI